MKKNEDQQPPARAAEEHEQDDERNSSAPSDESDDDENNHDAQHLRHRLLSDTEEDTLIDILKDDDHHHHHHSQFFERLCGSWDDRHGRDWKRLHIFLCLLIFVGSVGFLPFEYSRALLVVDEVEGRTSIELTAPLLEHAVDPAGVALQLLDEVRQALSLTVWDFRSDFLRFGKSNGVDSPALFASSAESPPLMFLSDVGMRAKAAVDSSSSSSSSGGGAFDAPSVSAMTVTYQLVTAVGTTTTTTTTNTESPPVSTTTLFSSTDGNATTVQMTTAAPTVVATAAPSASLSPGVTRPPVNVIGGYGEMGCSTMPETQQQEPHCFFVDNTRQRRTFDLELKGTLSAEPNVRLTKPALTRRELIWSETQLPSWQLSEGRALVWGELSSSSSFSAAGSSPVTPAPPQHTPSPAGGDSNTTTSSSPLQSVAPSTTASPLTTAATSTTSRSSSSSSNNLAPNNRTNLTLQLHAPLWISPEREPIIFASATVNVQRWQRIFLSEFERAQQNPGMVGLWLDRRGPTTAGTLVAWSKGYVDKLYNASDTPFAQVNSLVVQLLVVNGGLLPHHSVTLSDARDSTVFVCRAVAPHWITVTVIPESVVVASPQMQQFVSTAQKKSVLDSTISLIPMTLILCVFVLLTTFHGLIMAFRRPPQAAKNASAAADPAPSVSLLPKQKKSPSKSGSARRNASTPMAELDAELIAGGGGGGGAQQRMSMTPTRSASGSAPPSRGGSLRRLNTAAGKSF